MVMLLPRGLDPRCRCVLLDHAAMTNDRAVFLANKPVVAAIRTWKTHYSYRLAWLLLVAAAL